MGIESGGGSRVGHGISPARFSRRGAQRAAYFGTGTHRDSCESNVGTAVQYAGIHKRSGEGRNVSPPSTLALDRTVAR